MQLRQIFDNFILITQNNSISVSNMTVHQDGEVYCNDDMKVIPMNDILSGQYKGNINTYKVDYLITIHNTIQDRTEVQNYYITFNHNIHIIDDNYYNVTSSKKLYALINEISNRKNMDMAFASMMYYKYINLKYYAFDFMEKIIKEIGLFEYDEATITQLLNQMIIVPYLGKYYKLNDNGEMIADDIHAGHVLENKSNRVSSPIFIYNLWERNDIENTIRHELLHYYLILCNLPSKDNNWRHWVLATYYYADPYATLDTENKIIFDMWNNLYTIYLNNSDNIRIAEKMKTLLESTLSVVKYSNEEAVLKIKEYYSLMEEIFNENERTG